MVDNSAPSMDGPEPTTEVFEYTATQDLVAPDQNPGKEIEVRQRNEEYVAAEA